MSADPAVIRRTADNPLTVGEKDELLALNRSRLYSDLLEARLEFESMPRHIDLQLSNLCNMSCTMCYDGNNPELMKLDDEIVEEFAAAVMPTASMLAPFVGSEPLIYTWDAALSLAQRYRIQLDLITNAQFLDEEKLIQLEPHVARLTFSVDSHLRDVYERIRLRSKPDKVFQNIPFAAKWCAERGIDPVANVVFMVENAAFMDETVAAFADMGFSTVRLMAVETSHLGPERAYSDPVRHFSDDWIKWMLAKIKRVSEEKRIEFVYNGPKFARYDFRPEGLERREPKGPSICEELRYFYPGYCPQSVDHVKVHADGEVYPCCVADKGKLKLGDLRTQTFEEIWNGPNSRDLRRAMLTHDLPEFCARCSFHTSLIHDEHEHLPVVDWFHQVHCGGTVPPVPAERRTLEITGPDHMARCDEPPTFTWNAPAEPVDEFRLVFGLGGTFHEANVVFTVPGDATQFRPTPEQWAELRPHFGYWWTLFGLRTGQLDQSLRAPAVRCVTRHVDIPRIEGSTLYD